MRSENYVTVEFLSRSSNESFARMAAAGFAAQLDPTLDELGDIKTAVSEAVTNAIVHAYPDKLGKIVMKLRILEGNTLELSVRDWGCGIGDVEHAGGLQKGIPEDFKFSLSEVVGCLYGKRLAHAGQMVQTENGCRLWWWL